MDKNQKYALGTSLGDRGYAYNWWTKDYNINETLSGTYFGLGHGELAITNKPSGKQGEKS